MKRPIFGVDVVHSNGANPRPTVPGLRHLLTAARGRLHVILHEQFDGQTDGMERVDRVVSPDALFAALSPGRASYSGLRAHLWPDLGGHGRLSVSSYVASWHVYDDEGWRRRADVAALPVLPPAAHDARYDWLTAEQLDPLAWDEAIDALRAITTPDALLCWLPESYTPRWRTQRLIASLATNHPDERC